MLHTVPYDVYSKVSAVYLPVISISTSVYFTFGHNNNCYSLHYLWMYGGRQYMEVVWGSSMYGGCQCMGVVNVWGSSLYGGHQLNVLVCSLVSSMYPLCPLCTPMSLYVPLCTSMYSLCTPMFPYVPLCSPHIHVSYNPFQLALKYHPDKNPGADEQVPPSEYSL